jgi:hypothetical protein
VAREIQIISSSSGIHYILVGMDSNSLASFNWQLWITKYGPRAVDWVQALSLGWISFMGGDVWIHNSDAVPRNSFFGEQKYSEVGIVANEKADLIKVLDSIGIHSDGQWEVVSVTIPKTLNFPNGMYSKIPKGRFKKRDGIWSAEFLRNMKTSSGSISTIEAIRGETLRCNAAYLVLKNIDTSEVQLYKVSINMTANR